LAKKDGVEVFKNKRKKNKHSNPQKRDLISANEKKRINSRKRELLPAKNKDPQFYNGIVKLKEQKGSVIYPKITVFESETPRRENGTEQDLGISKNEMKNQIPLSHVEKSKGKKIPPVH
jgi:hypothetical protein